MNSRLLLTIVILVAYVGWEQFSDTELPVGSDIVSIDTATSSDSDWRSGQQVQGSGRVIRIRVLENEFDAATKTSIPFDWTM